VKIRPGSRLVFIGDSVTDCGRLRPRGEGSPASLGQGYVALVAEAVESQRPNPPITLTNMGISGNTVRDLASRWDSDVLALKPDWLSVMIGINDVWRQFDGIDNAAAVMPEEFERTYDGLIRRTSPLLKELVLMTPYFMQKSKTVPMRRRMDEYGTIVRELARKHSALLVDTQAAFDSAMEGNAFEALAPDRVHPSPLGHAVLAQAFLDAI
jgi:lysophospholipase L1-like esterase